MKNFRWKGKMVAALTIVFAAVTCAQPKSVKAETYEPAPVYEETYQAKNPNSQLGVAADFGVFVSGTAQFNAHSDTNVACGTLKLYNTNLTHKIPGTISYIQKAETEVKIAGADYIYFGSGNVENVKKNNVIESYRVNENKIYKENLKGVYKTASKTSFVDLNKEFEGLKRLAANLATENTTAEYTKVDNNNFIFICKTDYNVVNITAKDMNSFQSNIKINNLAANKVLIVNVNTENAGEKIEFKGQMMINNKAKEFDPLAGNIIWNFNDYSGKIKLMNGFKSGLVLAPNATITLEGSNLNGIAIAKGFKNVSGEAHYVPFHYDITTVKPVTVYADSVNGDCCPGIPLGEVEFAIYDATTNQMIEGTRQVVQNGSLEQLPEISKDNRYFAKWDIDKEGTYYIKVVKSPSGYNKTTIKAKFIVTKQNGELVLTAVKGKEANGYSNAWITNDLVRIRHYSQEVFATALDASTFEQLFDQNPSNSSKFELYSATNDVDDLTCVNLLGSFDMVANQFNYINIPKPGFYCVKQTQCVDGYTVTENIKKIAVFINPIGQYMVIELDQGEFSKEVLNAIFEDPSVSKLTLKIKKLTKNLNDKLIQLGYVKDDNGSYMMTNDYEALTDTCLMFLNNEE